PLLAMKRKSGVKSLESGVRRIVVKIGTSLFQEGFVFTPKYIASIVDDIVDIRKKGIEVIIVSSGAIGCGMRAFGIAEYPKAIQERQALASIGQPLLMDLYKSLFGKYNIVISQILLTHNELFGKKSSLNILNTFSLLFKLGVIPIVNENDSVAIEELKEELKIGDNDTLSSHLALLLNASCLIILTDEEGVYKLNKDDFSHVIPVISEITDEIRGFVKEKKGKNTIGGMKTKLKAAEMCIESGIPAIIASGKKERTLKKILAGKREGTLFLPRIVLNLKS
ncbi:MAG: glutamate 5-kinase, partial [bacterium]